MHLLRSAVLGRRTILVFFLTLGLIPATISAQRICCEGDRWLKWNSKLRENYVWGYLEGTHAYWTGCQDAIQAIQPKPTVAVADVCTKHQPDFSKGSDWLLRQVTQFYKRYPQDRDIYIDEVLEQLGKGLTVEEIHRHPFWRHHRQ